MKVGVFLYCSPCHNAVPTWKPSEVLLQVDRLPPRTANSENTLQTISLKASSASAASSMSNRSKRTLVAEVEQTFSQSCLSKWSKGITQGAKWDKVCSDARFYVAAASLGRTAVYQQYSSYDGLCCGLYLSIVLIHSSDDVDP